MLIDRLFLVTIWQQQCTPGYVSKREHSKPTAKETSKKMEEMNVFRHPNLTKVLLGCAGLPKHAILNVHILVAVYMNEITFC